MNFPDFIDAYMDYTFESESPDSYHLWVAMSIIGAAVGRRVVFEGGPFQTYANLFVLLIGPPGKTRKSTAINTGKSILKEVPGITIAPQSISREKLIEVFEDAYDEWRQESNVYVPNGEFGSLVNTSGQSMLGFLTHVYNGDEEEFRHETKGSGASIVKNPILSVLGATTPIWMQTEYPGASIDDGFGARMIFVVEDAKRKILAFPQPFDKKVKKKLIEDLTEISKRRGSIKFSESGKLAYQKFYEHINKPKPLNRDSRMDSFDDRLDVHMQKTAIICALSRGSQTVDKEDVERAFEFLVAIENKIGKIYSVLGNNKSLAVTFDIIELTKQKKRIPLSIIYDRFGHTGNYQELEMAVKMAVAGGKINHVIDPSGDYLIAKDE